MQSTRRLLATLTTASAGAPSRFLTAGNPTGLTGLLTHPSPRSTLVYLYSATLKHLATLPSSSAYRTSVEALTQHRLNIVSATKPADFEAWQERASQIIAENPAEFKTMAEDAPSKDLAPDWVEAKVWGRSSSTRWGKETPELEWDGEDMVVHDEGIQEDERRIASGPVKKAQELIVNWSTAPKLEAKQIAEIEEKIGAGLIEEVIEVANGELKLARTMAEHKVWEELAEKAPEGQWTYFARQQHMPGNQEPGNKP